MTGGLKTFKLLYLQFVFLQSFYVPKLCEQKWQMSTKGYKYIFGEKWSFKQHQMVIMLSPRSFTFNDVQKIKEKPMLLFLESQEQYRKSQAIG